MISQSKPATARFVFPVAPILKYQTATWFNDWGVHYGFRKDRMGRYIHHTGLDLNRGSGNQDRGDMVYATQRGRVVHVGYQRVGFGNFVVIQHDSGIPLWERHAHLDAVFVREGDWVEQGEEVGAIGNTGDPSGKMFTHLHFDYLYVNPELLPGGYANWPGSEEKALLKSYTDPWKVWSKWGAVNPNRGA